MRLQLTVILIESADFILVRSQRGDVFRGASPKIVTLLACDDKTELHLNQNRVWHFYLRVINN